MAITADVLEKFAEQAVPAMDFGAIVEEAFDRDQTVMVAGVLRRLQPERQVLAALDETLRVAHPWRDLLGDMAADMNAQILETLAPSWQPAAFDLLKMVEEEMLGDLRRLTNPASAIMRQVSAAQLSGLTQFIEASLGGVVPAPDVDWSALDDIDVTAPPPEVELEVARARQWLRRALAEAGLLVRGVTYTCIAHVLIQGDLDTAARVQLERLLADLIEVVQAIRQALRVLGS